MSSTAWDIDYQNLRKFRKDDTPDFMEGFDPHNMTKKQHDHMLAQVYDGYKTSTEDDYQMRGAGQDGRRLTNVGTKEVFSPGAYKDNEAWAKVAEAANISNINNKTDIAQMYQFIEDANNKKDLDKRFAALETANATEPQAEPTPEVPVKLSDRAVKAIDDVNSYENFVLPQQGNQIFGGTTSRPEQAFKDDYTLNLTSALKQKDPVTLASKKAEVELADKNMLEMQFGK